MVSIVDERGETTKMMVSNNFIYNQEKSKSGSSKEEEMKI